MEKLQLQSLEQEHRKLSAQLKDERDKNKHVVMSLVHECKQLAARVVEENQRFEELSSRTEQEGRSVGRLEEELASERRRSQQMEAEMEKQLAEFDTEREQLRSRLNREEMHAAAELLAESEKLRQQVEQLRTERCKDTPPLPSAPASAPVKPKTVASVAVGTEATVCKTASSQTDVPLENEGAKKVPLSIPVKPTGSTYASMNLPKTSSLGRGLHQGALRQKMEERAKRMRMAHIHLVCLLPCRLGSVHASRRPVTNSNPLLQSRTKMEPQTRAPLPAICPPQIETTLQPNSKHATQSHRFFPIY